MDEINFVFENSLERISQPIDSNIFAGKFKFATQNVAVYDDFIMVDRGNEILKIHYACDKAFIRNGQIAIVIGKEMKIFKDEVHHETIEVKNEVIDHVHDFVDMEIFKRTEIKTGEYFMVKDDMLVVKPDTINYKGKEIENTIHEDECNYFVAYKEKVVIIGNDKHDSFLYLLDGTVFEPEESNAIGLRLNNDFDPVLAIDVKFYKEYAILVDESMISRFKLLKAPSEEDKNIVDYKIIEDKLVKIDSKEKAGLEKLDSSDKNNSSSQIYNKSSEKVDIKNIFNSSNTSIGSMFDQKSTESLNKTTDFGSSGLSFSSKASTSDAFTSKNITDSASTETNSTPFNNNIFNSQSSSTNSLNLKSTALGSQNTNLFGSLSEDNKIKDLQSKDLSNIKAVQGSTSGESKDMLRNTNSSSNIFNPVQGSTSGESKDMLSNTNSSSSIFNPALNSSSFNSTRGKNGDLGSSQAINPNKSVFDINNSSMNSPVFSSKSNASIPKVEDKNDLFSMKSLSNAVSEKTSNTSKLSASTSPKGLNSSGASNNSVNNEVVDPEKIRAEEDGRKLNEYFDKRIKELKLKYQSLETPKFTEIYDLHFIESDVAFDNLYNRIFNSDIKKYNDVLSSMIVKAENLESLSTQNIKESIKYFDSKIMQKSSIRPPVRYKDPIIHKGDNSNKLQESIEDLINSIKIINVKDRTVSNRGLRSENSMTKNSISKFSPNNSHSNFAFEANNSQSNDLPRSNTKILNSQENKSFNGIQNANTSETKQNSSSIQMGFDNSSSFGLKKNQDVGNYQNSIPQSTTQPNTQIFNNPSSNSNLSNPSSDQSFNKSIISPNPVQSIFGQTQGSKIMPVNDTTSLFNNIVGSSAVQSPNIQQQQPSADSSVPSAFSRLAGSRRMFK